MFRNTLGLLLGVALFLSAHAVEPQYPDEAKSTRTTVTVHIVWLPSFKAVDAFCNFLGMQKGMITVGCYDPSSDTIYAVEPKNFNDKQKLEILGHEFWHALGAMHPVI